VTEAEFETGLDAHRDRVDINAEPAPCTPPDARRVLGVVRSRAVRRHTRVVGPGA